MKKYYVTYFWYKAIFSILFLLYLFRIACFRFNPITQKITSSGNVFNNAVILWKAYFNPIYFIYFVIFLFLSSNIFNCFLAIGDLREKSLMSIPKDIEFRDKRAKGYSLKNFWTRVWGWSWTLDVIVTQDDLITMVPSPWKYMDSGRECDLFHRIKRSDISEVAEHQGHFRKGYRITYKDEDGDSRQMILYLNEPDGFLKCLGHTPSRT